VRESELNQLWKADHSIQTMIESRIISTHHFVGFDPAIRQARSFRFMKELLAQSRHTAPSLLLPFQKRHFVLDLGYVGVDSLGGCLKCLESFYC
jgi:hypothetical protein